MSNYKNITVKDIIDFIEENKEYFPNGLDTVVMSGDFEGNYTHGKHEIQIIEDERCGNIVCLGYEMHENYYDE